MRRMKIDKIVTELTPLACRLAKVQENPMQDWLILVENVPKWPANPGLSLTDWDDGGDRYSPSQGTPELLDVLYGRAVDQHANCADVEILVTNGGFDAIAQCVRYLKRDGVERIFCAGPILLSLQTLLRSALIEPKVIPWNELIESEVWDSPRLGPTDAFYINTPHNPTGACLHGAAVERLLEAQQKRGFAVIFDLVYDSFCFNSDCRGTPISIIEDWYRVFTVNSFSKNYGAPGLRIGWLMTRQNEARELVAQFEAERISVSTSAQFYAAELCRYGNKPLVEAVFRSRVEVLAWAVRAGLKADSFHGGTQVWLDLERLDADQVADKLMSQSHVVLTTGYNYYPVQDNRLRIPVGGSREVLSAGLKAIELLLNQP